MHCGCSASCVWVHSGEQASHVMAACGDSVPAGFAAGAVDMALPGAHSVAYAQAGQRLPQVAQVT